MITTVVVSVLGGLAFRKRFKGSTILFYLTVTSLVIPSILVSLGVGLMFDQLGLTVLEQLGIWRTIDMDAALWSAVHVCSLQPV